MTSHFLICIFQLKILLGNPTEFPDLAFSNLHILLLDNMKILSYAYVRTFVIFNVH